MIKIALPYLEGFLFLLILLSACGTDPTPSADPSITRPGTIADLELVVKLGRLRETPSPDGRLLQQLEKGQNLIDLGAVSPHTTRVVFGTEAFDEPWLEVRVPAGPSGWIYGREVAPTASGVSVEDFRRQKLLQSIFGPQAFQRLQEYRQHWDMADNEQELAACYQEGFGLRDTLAAFLEKKSYDYAGKKLPDLFWIADYIPGFVPQLIAKGSVYYLFFDYAQWLQRATGSTGKQDDRFFSLLVQCFPQDSIEYFYPAWELQTDENRSHNLLGRGITLEILSGIEQIQAQTPLFSKALQILKVQIVEGITQPVVHFWEADTVVMRELDEIIQANWSIFTTADRIALETRRHQLDSATLHQIRFNARAGE